MNKAYLEKGSLQLRLRISRIGQPEFRVDPKSNQRFLIRKEEGDLRYRRAEAVQRWRKGLGHLAPSQRTAGAARSWRRQEGSPQHL